jgi:hypothetical protein
VAAEFDNAGEIDIKMGRRFPRINTDKIIITKV